MLERNMSCLNSISWKLKVYIYIQKKCYEILVNIVQFSYIALGFQIILMYMNLIQLYIFLYI
jgi:hypothetical protein